MTDKLTCPYCERTFDLDSVEGAEIWRERAEIAARLGPSWGLANEYVECFCASRGSRVSLKKRVRILGEVLRLWERGVFEFGGKRYKVAQKDISEAMYQICQRDKIGFSDHNYLKKVLLDKASVLSAEGLTSSEEVVREQKRREGPGNAERGTWNAEEEENHEKINNQQSPIDNPDRVLSAAENARRAREIAAGIGKKME